MSFFIFAGELSGDLHGAHLIQALKNQSPAPLKIEGVAGPSMRNQGVVPLMQMEEFQVMGYSDVIQSLPKLWKQFYRVRDFILDTRPNGVILIDYPGFNLRLAKSLRSGGYKGKLIQYICPSIWAHGKSRIQTMVKTLDLLLTIYPFEAAFFEHTTLQVEYIGNPLVEMLQSHSYLDGLQSFGIEKNRLLLSLFPGSRLGEIKRNLDDQLQVAAYFKKKDSSLCLAISCVNDQVQPLIENSLDYHRLKLNQDIFLIPKQFSYDLMRNSHAALAKSGTVTLELALHHCPSVVTYRLSLLNYFLAKYWLRLNLPYYCIVNILGKQEIFPEFIEKGVSIHQLNETLHQVLYNKEKRTDIIENCHLVEQLLGNKKSSYVAAKTILELL